MRPHCGPYLPSFQCIPRYKAQSQFEHTLTAGVCVLQDIVLLSAIGRLLLQWGNLVGAERYFRLVRELAQDDSSKLALVRMNQGLELVGRDRYSDALRAFELVVEVDPGNLWAANNQAVCYVYLRDLQRAISSLEQLIAANPEANISVRNPVLFFDKALLSHLNLSPPLVFMSVLWFPIFSRNDLTDIGCSHLQSVHTV